MESRASRMFVGGGKGVADRGCFGGGERVVIPRVPEVSELGGAAVYAVGTEGRQETASGERAPRCQLGAGSPGRGGAGAVGGGCSLTRRGVTRGRGLWSHGVRDPGKHGDRIRCGPRGSSSSRARRGRGGGRE